MKKQDAMEYIRKKMGYIPYSGIFDMFSDDDEIPQGLVDVECIPTSPKCNFIITSALVAEALSEVLSKPLGEKETDVLNKTYKKSLSNKPTKFKNE